MERKDFHHALTILQDVCIGCSHCMRVCPTEALRVQNGKATLYENRCVDCGECFRVCPVKAIIIEQDDYRQIFNYKHRVALTPSVFFGQFSEKISPAAVQQAMLEIGFTEVFELENSAEILSHAINRYIVTSNSPKPIISSFCPAIIRLIQVRFPALVDNIMLLQPPLDISAGYYRKKLIDAGVGPEDIGIFYITPCAAKIAAIKSPVGEEVSEVTGVINMDTMYNLVLKNIKQKAGDGQKSILQPYVKGKSMMWSLTNGESSHINGRCLSIDGIASAIEFLEKLEDEEDSEIDFLEIRSCDEGCAGGVLCYGNRFLTVERMRKRSKQMGNTQAAPLASPGADMWDYYPYLLQKMSIEPIKPRSMVKLDEDMAKAMKKMERVRRIMTFLPGIDCGVCGAPTCQALAEDIVQGKGAISECVFLQKNMEHTRKLHPDHSFRIMERIWGKDRFQKTASNVNKKNQK
jgi:iron only hydrogenase large subunit-like protein